MLISAYYLLKDGKMQKTIDEADRRILRELQSDSSRPVTELAEAVGLSHAPCWRRIQRLRGDGLIKREKAVLDHAKLGWELEVFVFLKISAQGRARIHEFRREIVAHERVVDAYILLGSVDMMLHVVARNMVDYQRFYLDHLSGLTDLADVNSMTVMATLKEGELPV